MVFLRPRNADGRYDQHVADNTARTIGYDAPRTVGNDTCAVAVNYASTVGQRFSVADASADDAVSQLIWTRTTGRP